MHTDGQVFSTAIANTYTATFPTKQMLSFLRASYILIESRMMQQYFRKRRVLVFSAMHAYLNINILSKHEAYFIPVLREV